MRWAAVFGAGCAAGAVGVILLTHSPTLTRSHSATSATEASSEAQPSNLLVLPQASQSFGGVWHGLLKEAHPKTWISSGPGEKSRWVMDPEERTVGLQFEVRDGQVSARAVMWSSQDWRLVESSGRVLAPNHVVFRIEALNASGTDPIWTVQEIDATLERASIHCDETISYYKTPGADPYETKVFVGTLRPISRAELQAIREVEEKKGFTPRGTVEAK